MKIPKIQQKYRISSWTHKKKKYYQKVTQTVTHKSQNLIEEILKTCIKHIMFTITKQNIQNVK